ncbi:MAG TPA: peptidase MA family metallohydrolase [Planctomycetota bacterium]|nr:peptidase MA family metallohydrolase [Planctomycetota bacterium]
MFLPLISAVLLLAAAPAPVVPFGAGQEPGRVAAEIPLGGGQVVAGSGSPAPAVIAEIQAMVDTELGRLVPVFDDLATHRFFVFVHGDRDSMPAELAAHLHPNSPGFALLGQRQIHIVWGEMRRTGASSRGVVVHELVHELLDQFAAPHGSLMPRWFHEGLAQFLAGDTYLGASEEDLVWRVSTRRLLSFDSLRKGFPADEAGLRTAYGQSYSYVSWLVREYGLDALLSVARATDERTSFERALVGWTRRSTLELEEAWQDHLLHGSGASWRVWFQQSFSLLLIAALPVLVLALIRRLAAEQRAARQMAAREAAAPIEIDAAPATDAEATDAGADDSEPADERS